MDVTINKHSTIGRFFAPAAAIFFLFTSTAYADDGTPPWTPQYQWEGMCWAYPVDNLYLSILPSAFDSNKKGASANVTFSTNPSSYNGWCYSMKDSESGRYGTIRFAVGNDLDMNQSANYGYGKLTDDIDVKLYVDGLNNPIPIWGLGPVLLTQAKTKGKGYTRFTGETAGTKGSAIIKLRRDIIGGAIVIPAGRHVGTVELAVDTNVNSTATVYKIYTSQLIFPVPTECKINGGKTMDIRFGNIDSSRLTTSALSSSYKQPGNLTYKCNTSLNQDMMVQLVADPAGFGDAIKTSNANIGVVMLRQDAAVKPGDKFRAQFINGEGSDTVSFALVGNGSKPTAGPFTGNAALILTSL